jgi:hypothetical protein
MDSPFFNAILHPYELGFQLGEAKEESHLIMNFIVASSRVLDFRFGDFGGVRRYRAVIEE